MATRNELKKLAGTRLKEAKLLYNGGFYDGAYYLAGYVVELALKARICRVLDLTEYLDSGEISRSFKTHRLDDLVRLAGLQKKFEQAKLINPVLTMNWSLISVWNEQLRYSPIGTSPSLLVQRIINALENRNDGVFTWIKKHW